MVLLNNKVEATAITLKAFSGGFLNSNKHSSKL